MIGILVVSFGTSFDETREKNITAIEQEIRELGYPVYRAFTSNIIRKVLAKREIFIDDVTEAMHRMVADGVTEVYVLPTHLLYGYEYEKMMSMIESYEAQFQVLKIGKPLLADTEDMLEALSGLIEAIEVAEDEAIVFMGHGTEHFANAVYPALNYMAREQGYSHVFVGTVEGYPLIDVVISEVKKAGYQKVLLTPLMLVAGDHAANDMSGDDEDSWKSLFHANGVETRILLKGLGEYEEIRKMYRKHLQEIME